MTCATLLGRERVVCIDETGKPQCVEDSFALWAGSVAEHGFQIRVAPGQVFELTVVLNVRSAAVTNWAYGVAHDPEKLELLDVTTVGSDIGYEPDFNVTRFAGGTPTPGFVSGVVLSLDAPKFLPVGDDFVLARAKYKAISYLAPDEVSFVAFTSDLALQGSPPQPLVIGIDGVESRPRTVIDAEVLGTEKIVDCNANGVSDRDDLQSGTSIDCNENGLPDECDVSTFARFAAPAPITDSVRASGAVVFDATGDSVPDVVAADASAPQIVVIRHDAASGFAAPQGFPIRDAPASLLPASIQAADLDRDGDLDLAVGTEPATGGSWNVLSVLPNHGDGDFSGPEVYDLGAYTGFDPRAVLLGDFGQDGDIDVALWRPSSGWITVFENNGSAHFERAADIPATSGQAGAFAGPFDGIDGTDFLIVRAPPADSLLIRNSGVGEFALPDPVTFDERMDDVACGDLNGDAILDLVETSAFSDRVSVRLNGGNGAFSPQRNYFVEKPQQVQVGDADADGDLDIVVGIKPPRSDQGHFATVEILLNDGDGVFRLAGENAMQETYGFFTGDVDADGRLDLVTPARTGSSLWLSRLESVQTGADCNANGVPDSCDLTAGFLHDADANGIPDECESRFHRGDPNQSGALDISDAVFTFAFLFLGRALPSCLDAADANNDGRLDLSDGVFLLNYRFLGAIGPPVPGSPSFPCGRDTEPPGAAGNLGCELYAPCE